MKLRYLRSAILGVALGSLASVAFAQAPPAGGTAAVPMAKTVYDNVVTPSTAKITLTSTSIKAAQPIPDTYTQNGANKSPQLGWTAGPPATKSYVVVTQDTTTTGANPVQHWIIWNIPANVTALPEGVPLGVTLTDPPGAMQATAAGSAGFRGPKPPAGALHNYVFQVFAMDSMLSGIDTTVNAPMLIAAMTGHVIAAGSFNAPYTGK